jgi:hypothetical protein
MYGMNERFEPEVEMMRFFLRMQTLIKTCLG